MFCLYTQCKNQKGLEFCRTGVTALAGSRSGLIVKYLRSTTSKSTTEPYQWHMNVEQALRSLQFDKSPNALVIDANPNGKQVQLFLLKDIWGYSDHGWTPIMLRMLLLTEDSIDKGGFELGNLSSESVFTFLYLKGTVKNGKFEGSWNFPGPSSTNSVFLWPDALDYFTREAQLSR